MSKRNLAKWLIVVVATMSIGFTEALPVWPADASTLPDPIAQAHFAEPLIATGPTTSEEDEALAAALVAFNRRMKSDDYSALEGFLSAHPQSGWVAALQTNLGISYLHDGYFSRAITAWTGAWEVGKTATEPRAVALVDRAVGERAQLYASLGQFDQLKAFSAEVGKRPISGSATEAVQNAQELLTLTTKDPRHLFICGPLALRALMLKLGADFAKVDFLQWYRASPRGTNLAELGALADKAAFQHQVVFREPGQPVPIPSLIHWKVGHFAAVLEENNGRYHVADSVFPNQEIWVTKGALDQEASGYFMVPGGTKLEQGWRQVADAEAGTIWGKGPSNNTQPGGSHDPKANHWPRPHPRDPIPSTNPQDNQSENNSDTCSSTCGCKKGMCDYGIKESEVSLTLSDSPVGYNPPVGLQMRTLITYNQREDSQPAVFNFTNVSPKWTVNWISYITDDPTNQGASVSRFESDGSAYYYTGYASGTSSFTPQIDDNSTLVVTSWSPVTYQRTMLDGSTETFSQSDGSTAFPRRIFLTKRTDRQGNAITFNYDGQMRLTSITDSTGRQTTFTYGWALRPLQITKITDPFGRSAVLAYDSSGRLASITDVIGITSSFTYDANSLVNSMTTPYGTSNFAYTAPGTTAPPRFVDVTDPLGYHEREEWLEPAPISASDPVATVPTGMPLAPTNQYLQYRDSFHWDKNQYIVAGCTPTGGCDYTKARDTHFLHFGSASQKSMTVESIKEPLENRVWYGYPGQTSSFRTGTSAQPTAIGRVLDDGSTQLVKFTYDSYFNLTSSTDPVGRVTHYIYSGNNADLLSIYQDIANGAGAPLVQITYNSLHRPASKTDAAGQTTIYKYNATGLLTSETNALGQTTTYNYNSTGDLTTIVNANNQTAATYTYDAFDRVRTYTDSEGWTVTYDYDALDRVTKVTYPDGTTDRYSYDKLDLASYQDREYRTWTYTTDADRRVTKITDPTNNNKQFTYDAAANLTGLTDAANVTTNWTYDLESRLSTKKYADNSAVSYAYESTISRLHSVTDALSQIKQYTYTQDDRVSALSYYSAVNPTPNVTFTYDPYFPRVSAMTDGTGTTQYSYQPVFSLGALQLQQEISPLASSAIAYTYDELGRVVSRAVAGAAAETWQYDALGRITNHGSDLGQFTLSYLGQTSQVTSRQLTGSTLSTNWSYLPNSGDRRLAGIGNTGLASGQYLNFAYTTTPENFVIGIAETSDVATVYPAALTQTASYNNLNQLTNLSGQALTYDANGNLLSDGTRTYAWDAENRLVSIGYPGQPGKLTAFTYDGLDRRTAIASTPAGGGAATTSNYVWCASSICQSRGASNAVLRSYYDEGELAIGSPSQPYYYGTDQIGTVRRVFSSPSTSAAYSYDAYGTALQSTAPVTDYNYAGMLYNSDSGLYLTLYRAYDPGSGRWLSRDRLGEESDASTNLYAYVGGNATDYIDPLGLQEFFLGTNPAEFFPSASEESAPFLRYNEWSPESVSERMSAFRRDLGLPEDSGKSIPDNPYDRGQPGGQFDPKYPGPPAKPRNPHPVGQRNQGADEEHSMKPKGGFRPRSGALPCEPAQSTSQDFI
jgi:RHS repeat-associated protein